MESLFETHAVRCSSDGEVVLLRMLGTPPRIGVAVLDGITRGTALAEERRQPMIVAGDAHFAFGADLDDAFAAVRRGSTTPLEELLVQYQATMLSLRHARVPTVAAVAGVAVSGGCELLMHCTRVVAKSESSIGLREALVGVLPGGGGVKELALRAARAADFEAALARAFETLSHGRMSSGAAEAFELGFLRAGADVVIEGDDVLAAAKREALALAAAGHSPPTANPTMRVGGGIAFERMLASLERRRESGEASAHDVEIGRRIALVLCGGDGDRHEAEEAELLRLEREHFIVLAQSEKTQARLDHLLTTGGLLSN